MGTNANSYKANFRFNAEVGKGLFVGDSFIPVSSYSTSSLTRPVFVDSTDDQSILLGLISARKFKHIHVNIQATDDTQSAILRLHELRFLEIPFLASLGVQRNVFGKRAELYILRDKAAKLVRTGNIGDGKSPALGFTITLGLTSPELLHGVGDNFNVKKV